MQTGKILVAQHQATFVIKLVGDVRLTLSTTIDDYFNEMFSSSSIDGVVIDLSEAQGIDSTSLGLLAKLAIQAKQLYQLVPMILSPNPNITRLLDSMGFNQVFDIHQDLNDQKCDNLGELPMKSADEACCRSKVIEAHRVLMDMNETNRETFSALVDTLEAAS
ncbi:STAS domain-containing protein [Oceanicoccus sagamiensis]|uniref:Anti-anti-sigma factor n=1 Tax=Oceanicoccus sagamiensis TaxID=716816 RepID=A0A1X9NDR1_9GAMM|nr:STAS domain-containing protein [Oceanicoccus sagamiensis]ARN75291.1 anti-anti-sigma factor [Oceanicoccus sagamiensis]